MAPRIDPSDNGPYVVRNLETLTNSRGEALATKPTIALCRCGHSGNKPFCDGSHTGVGFASRRQTDGTSDRRRDYQVGRLTVHDNRGICAHAGLCTEHLPSVFRSGQSPWIDPGGAEEGEIAALVCRCPSGALSYSLAGVEQGDADRPPAIVVSQNGPYVATGGVELTTDTWGEGASREHYTLCRCGRSKNKPFCDGSHWDGFVDEKN